MASGVGPVLSLDTSINFVLYKLSIANMSLLLNEMKVPSYEAALSLPYHCVLPVQTYSQETSFLIALSTRREKNLLHRGQP